MSRAAKIQKLGNAIRRYRGLLRGDHWVHSPQPAAALDVVRWCDALKLPASDTLAKIDAFASLDEFKAWMKAL